MNTITNRLCKTLNLRSPIFQAPMGGVVTPQLASAVANYGALGMLPLGNRPLDFCETLIDDTLALTKQGVALGVNLVLEWDQTERLAMSLEKGIKIFWFFWGDPSPFIETIHAHEGVVILTVGSAEQARQAVADGVDIIVSQGWEAGGHVCSEVATLPLVPAVIDAVENKVPVVAAGGVADGRGLAAALSLGAEGAVLGTRLLLSSEAGVHKQYQTRLLQAQETNTVYTDLFDKGWENSFMRVLRNSTYEQWLAAGTPPPGERPGEHDIITQFSPERLVERYSYCLPAPVMEGDLEPMAHYAGQVVGLIHEIKPIHDIFDEVIAEAINNIKRCQSLVS